MSGPEQKIGTSGDIDSVTGEQTPGRILKQSIDAKFDAASDLIHTSHAHEQILFLVSPVPFLDTSASQGSSRFGETVTLLRVTPGEEALAESAYLGWAAGHRVNVCKFTTQYGHSIESTFLAEGNVALEKSKRVGTLGYYADWLDLPPVQTFPDKVLDSDTVHEMGLWIAGATAVDEQTALDNQPNFVTRFSPSDTAYGYAQAVGEAALKDLEALLGRDSI